jgi:hypothetical protein
MRAVVVLRRRGLGTRRPEFLREVGGGVRFLGVAPSCSDHWVGEAVVLLSYLPAGRFSLFTFFSCDCRARANEVLQRSRPGRLPLSGRARGTVNVLAGIGSQQDRKQRLPRA